MNRSAEYSQIDSVIKLFERSVKLYKNNPLIWEKPVGVKGAEYLPTTYGEIKAEAQKFGAALLKNGLRKGDRVALLAEGRKDWLVAELGMFYVGVVNVPLSVKLDSNEVAFRVAHSGAKMIIVSGIQASKAEAILDEIDSLASIVYFDKSDEELAAANASGKSWKKVAMSFSKMLEDGNEYLQDDESHEIFTDACGNVEPDDLANISYTSGTTAAPKGIMLTLRNYAANALQSCSRVMILPSSRSLTILPWDHSFAHTANIYCFIYYGASIATQEQGRTPIETLKNIPKNIKEIKPDLMMSVPALSKTFRKNIENGIRQKGKMAEKLFSFFLKASYTYNADGFSRGKGWRALLKPVVSLGDKLMYAKVREGLGGNLKYFIGGGALLDVELQRFFAAIGIPIMQGYGLSEAAPVISTNSLDMHKFGTSGKIVDFLELKICDADGKELPNGEKGEIVIKGDNVMAGYWNNPEATAEALVDGWLHTGDMGLIDKDGFLVVLGRFKSLLIGNDGEKYSPEGIEESIVDCSPIIEHCILYNNQSAYTSGMIVPNVQQVKLALQSAGKDINTEDGQNYILKLIDQALNEYRKGGKMEGMFPERWLPAAVVILPENFTEANHLLNSTMKVVRGKVTEYFKKEFDFVYTADAKNICNAKNREALKKIVTEK
ncbi:MAG: AMP-binding protein [Bacteroidales bacterium]|nr:AMP-binding protein [Bacteroidales bacterium]